MGVAERRASCPYPSTARRVNEEESAARTLAWVERRVGKGTKANFQFLKAQLTNCQTAAFRLTHSKRGVTANASGLLDVRQWFRHGNAKMRCTCLVKTAISDLFRTVDSERN